MLARGVGPGEPARLFGSLLTVGDRPHAMAPGGFFDAGTGRGKVPTPHTYSLVHSVQSVLDANHLSAVWSNRNSLTRDGPHSSPMAFCVCKRSPSREYGRKNAAQRKKPPIRPVCVGRRRRIGRALGGAIEQIGCRGPSPPKPARFFEASRLTTPPPTW